MFWLVRGCNEWFFWTNVYEPQPNELDDEDDNEATTSKVKSKSKCDSTVERNNGDSVKTENKLGEDKL